MIIGVPKEIKNSEYRVGLTETNVRHLVERGHKVLIQEGAGVGSGISNEQYIKAGARLMLSSEEVYSGSDMIVKVKEPLSSEYEQLKERQILFTFLHLAPLPELTDALCQKKVKALAYETIETEKRELPLLKPMSQVAGRVALQNGVVCLQKNFGGKGVLPGGAPGVEKSSVVIVGAGTAGLHAAAVAVGLQARVTLLDINLNRLELIDKIFHGRVETLFSDKKNLEECVRRADLVIGSVLLAGHKAPKLITKEMIQSLKSGSVVVDISIDQGGSVETARVTSHENPTYIEYDVIHYCVPNIPSVVSRTSTYALTNASFPFVLSVADKGLEEALKSDPALKKGLNTYEGHITCQPVAEALNREFVPNPS